MISENNTEKIWKLIFSCRDTRGIIERDLSLSYKDIDDKLHKFEELARRNLFNEINTTDLDNLSKEYWKRLITKSCDDLLDTINNRQTRGGEFARNINTIKQLREDISYEKFELKKHDTFYNFDLKGQRDEIKEKVDNEKHVTKQFWINVFIGIGGIIIGIIVAYIFFKLSSSC